MPIRRLAPGKFKIDNVAGTSPTLKKARERLRAIKARQSDDAARVMAELKTRKRHK